MKLKEKNNILMNLANHTEKSVLMPENPVTLDNPDGIYLYRGRIFALFIPTSAERSNYDHLLRRLYVSQLSYSSDLVTILLLDADDKVGGDGEFIFHESFCHVSRSFDDVLRYIAGVGDINRDWGIIKEHRSIQYQKHIRSISPKTLKTRITVNYHAMRKDCTFYRSSIMAMI